MLETVLVALIVLWVLGFVQVNGLVIPHIKLFMLNGHTVTLSNVLIAIVVIWIADLLPSPFRQLAALLFVLYVLSVLGIITVAGFSNIVVVTMILGVVVYLFQRTPRTRVKIIEKTRVTDDEDQE